MRFNKIIRAPEILAASLLIVAVGTAQCMRTLRFIELLGRAGRLDRVQAFVAYDTNVATVNYLSNYFRANTRKIAKNQPICEEGIL